MEYNNALRAEPVAAQIPSASTASASAKKIPEVDMAMTQLDSRISILADTLIKLDTRLKSVMRHPGAEPSSEGSAFPPSDASPLVISLRESTRRVEILTEHVQLMLDLLET
jgi:hypothetical protein